jgi:hypothetical protein
VTHLRPPNSLTAIFKKELWHGKEVFKIFLTDILESRRINIFLAKHFKIVAYSLFYLICILFILFSLVLAMTTKTVFPIFIGMACPITASFFLALKYVTSVKQYNLLFGMTILLMTYGFSRALSLLSFNKLGK